MTREQRKVAEKLGIDIINDSERVAAARIEEYIYLAIHPGKQLLPPSERQMSFEKSIGIESRGNSRLVISAKITDELEKQNIEAIEKLNLSSGDEVIINELGIEKKYIISSIGGNYRLWFKGGMGRGAWPTAVISKI